MGDERRQAAGLPLAVDGPTRWRGARARGSPPGDASRHCLFAMPGLWSSDVLDYASHGRVAAVHAANPYVMTPADFPADPFARLGGWPDVVTVYGPLWTRLEVAITGALAEGTSVQLVLAFKLLALASELISAGLIFWIVRRWRSIGATDATPVAAVAMWGGNPLANLETIGRAHHEGVRIAL